jgi:glucose-6-phosphate 1-dehydrogenase
LYNAIFGKKDVFTSNVEILKSWQIFDSLLEKWNKSEKIQIYKKGSSFEQIEEEKTTN